MPPGEALILMGKSPRPGRVKTRLCPPLSREDASDLCACLLADTAEEMASLRRVRRYLFIDPPEEVGCFRDPPFSGYERFPQRGGSLGTRMSRAAEKAFRDGAAAVAIIGGDIPSLSAGRVAQAFREMGDGAGAVLGPSEDGGFYLVGLTRPDPLLFRGIAWSRPTVLHEVAARLRAAETPFAYLAPERDVDLYEDLVDLRKWADSHGAPSCPRTRRWITAFFGPAGAFPGRGDRTGGPPRGSRSRRGG